LGKNASMVQRGMTFSLHRKNLPGQEIHCKRYFNLNVCPLRRIFGQKCFYWFSAECCLAYTEYMWNNDKLLLSIRGRRLAYNR
jgi:hypothetical protein